MPAPKVSATGFVHVRVTFPAELSDIAVNPLTGIGMAFSTGTTSTEVNANVPFGSPVMIRNPTRYMPSVMHEIRAEREAEPLPFSNSSLSVASSADIPPAVASAPKRISTTSSPKALVCDSV